MLSTRVLAFLVRHDDFFQHSEMLVVQSGKFKFVVRCRSGDYAIGQSTSHRCSKIPPEESGNLGDLLRNRKHRQS